MKDWKKFSFNTSVYFPKKISSFLSLTKKKIEFIKKKKYLVNLKNNAKLENNFEKLGIDINKNYTKIISSVNTKRLANNPVDLNLVDLKKIIQS